MLARGAANTRLASTDRSDTLGWVSVKRYLFTPGPTTVPPEVLAALAQPVVHHRGSDYRPLYAECLQRDRKSTRLNSSHTS